MSDLRHKLMKITEDVPLQEHPALIVSLQEETNHSIVVVESEHPIERYTCAVHAFHLIDNAIYEEVASFGLGLTFAGYEFINFLLERGLLTPRDGYSVLPDDLVLYFDNGVFRHVGRMKTHHRVLSKWGIGYLYEHLVCEVPLSYGEEIRYFVGPNEELSVNLFIQYAESKGFSFEWPPQA